MKKYTCANRRLHSTRAGMADSGSPVQVGTTRLVVRRPYDRQRSYDRERGHAVTHLVCKQRGGKIGKPSVALKFDPSVQAGVLATHTEGSRSVPRRSSTRERSDHRVTLKPMHTPPRNADQDMREDQQALEQPASLITDHRWESAYCWCDHCETPCCAKCGRPQHEHAKQ